MKNIILLLRKIYLLLLFIIFEAAAIVTYSHSSDFTEAKLLSVSNSVLGAGHRAVSGVVGYFSLRKENNDLTSEIAQLRNQLEHFRGIGDSTASQGGSYPYFFSSANVINNSISGQRNYITLDKGSLDGVKPNMAIATPRGEIVGYVMDCSNKFSVCISVLNTDFRNSGRINNTDSYGPIVWDGRSTEYITLTDIPKYTQINPGDSVLTTSFSSIFPPDLLIGTVESYDMTESMLYQVKVRLAAPMGSLRHVLLINYIDFADRKQLEEQAREREPIHR